MNRLVGSLHRLRSLLIRTTASQQFNAFNPLHFGSNDIGVDGVGGLFGGVSDGSGFINFKGNINHGYPLEYGTKSFIMIEGFGALKGVGKLFGYTRTLVEGKMSTYRVSFVRYS